MTIINGHFEWDSEKNKENIKKHGFSFEEILPVFEDPLFYEEYDKMHSSFDEVRFFGIGRLNGFTIISTCYTENERIRIISSRISTVKEERAYEKWCEQFYP